MLGSDPLFMSEVQQQVQELLIGDADALFAGVILAVIGLAAILAFCIRRRPRAGLLLWFGLIALLYGVRILARTDTIHIAFGFSEIFWRYLNSFITYIIIIPFAFFIEEIYGRGWKSSMRALVWIQSCYAVAAVLSDIIRRSPESVPDPVYLFFAGLACALALGRISAYRPPLFEESRAIFIGLSIFILFVIHEHLVEFGLVPWSLHIETLGFFLFVVLLGVIALRRFIINEQKLAALEHEMDAARRIQASILPRELPMVAGCRLAVRYMPMASVAGDFYDFVTLDEFRLGVLIADVAGHGVPAALIASMVKVGLSSQASHWSDPATVMSGLNHVLCKQQTGQFVTAAYILLDFKEAGALYSGAAHPPLFLWRGAQREILEVEENGLLLGFRQHEKYTNVPIRLIRGDRIIMYTDGITEAAGRSGDLFGAQRLKEFIRANSHLPADPFADRMLQDLASWSGKRAGGAQEDDLTLIVLDIQ